MFVRERFQIFTILIAKVNRYVHKIKTEEMAEFNLKSTHVSCLYYLYGQRGLTAKELCEVCDEDKGAISRSIDFLETNGYLTCSSKTLKRYKCPVELTEKGEEVAKKLVDKIDKILEEASKGLNENDREIFYKSLSLIAGNLGNICEK